MKIIYRLFKEQYRLYRKELLSASLLAFLNGICTGVIPLLLILIVDGLTTNNESPTLLVLYSFLLLLKPALSILETYVFMPHIEASIWTIENKRVFKHMLNLPMNYHKEADLHEDIELAWKYPVATIEMIIHTYMPFIGMTSGLIFAGVSLSHLSIYFFPLCLIIGLIYFLAVYKLIRGGRDIQEKDLDIWNKIWAWNSDAIFSAASIKQNTAENAIEKKAAELYTEMYETNKKYHQNKGLVNDFYEISRSLLTIGTMLLGVLLFTKGLLSVGALVGALSLVVLFLEPFRTFATSYASIETAFHRLHAGVSLLGQKEENFTGGSELASSRIEFDDVSFSYKKEEGSEPTLAHVSFVVEAGESIAFVGESGAGKSTIVELLLRFIEKDSGTILLGEDSIEDINLLSLRKNIAVVPQDVLLLNDTLLRNITIGGENYTDEEIAFAIEKAHLSLVIDKLPQGLQTLVGNRGMKLSGGERQRVAIARAFLRNPKILILDEPTSALDAKSESIVIDSLREIMKGRTTIIIAHRFSTIESVDRIYTFKGGTITESGTHTELLKKGGDYAALYQLQKGKGYMS